MYGVPKKLESLAIVGSPLAQLCLGPYIVHFSFDSGHQISAEGTVEVVQGGEVISTWTSQQGWSTTKYQGLLRASVVSCSVPHSKVLVISFEGDLALHVHDSSEQFESFSVHPGDIYV